MIEPYDRQRAERLMRRAIELSRQGMEAGEGGPFGAVIARGETIIGEGWNQVIATNDPTAHAEVVAIRVATRSMKDFHLTGCDLYTSAQPCPMCLGALYWARINRIYYGNSVQDAAAIGFDDEFFCRQLRRAPQDREIQEIQLLATEARQVFHDFAAKPDSVRY